MFLNIFSPISLKRKLLQTNVKVIKQIILKNYSLLNYKNNSNIFLNKVVLQCKKISEVHHDELECLINKQIGAEQQAAQDYLGIAIHFSHPSISRPGLAGYFMALYKEELGHMHEFIQYQLLRCGHVCLSPIKVTAKSEPTMLDAFYLALEMENQVTMSLQKIIDVATLTKDHECADFITSKFLHEQIKSINSIINHITNVTRLSDEHAIYHYNLELAKLYPETKPFI